MFGLLRAAFTLLICVLVVGFFLGWFTFNQAPPDPNANRVNINVSVDKAKMGSDLQRLEQNVSKRIQDLNTPQSSASPPANPASPASNFPQLSIGPLSVQPTGKSDNQATNPQSGISGLPLGPLSMQPAGPAPDGSTAPSGPPQLRLQTQDYQFTLPLTSPPPGEGR